MYSPIRTALKSTYIMASSYLEDFPPLCLTGRHPVLTPTFNNELSLHKLWTAFQSAPTAIFKSTKINPTLQIGASFKQDSSFVIRYENGSGPAYVTLALEVRTLRLLENNQISIFIRGG
jgi:hypothetical protein